MALLPSPPPPPPSLLEDEGFVVDGESDLLVWDFPFGSEDVFVAGNSISLPESPVVMKGHKWIRTEMDTCTQHRIQEEV